MSAPSIARLGWVPEVIVVTGIDPGKDRAACRVLIFSSFLFSFLSF